MKIAFIGAGNVAWHLAIAFENAGHPVREVYSRNEQHARELVSMLYDAQVNADLNFAESQSGLFVLAVPDDAIEDIAAQLVLPEGAILVHTSGSKSLDSLYRLTEIYSDVPVQTGVLYPLQTFNKATRALSFENIPLCVEASEKATEEKLVILAQELSSIVYLVNSRERKVLHVAAVFACNFSNYLFGIAKDITAEEELDFTLLKPLIQETVRKALSAPHPALVQTGPAQRGDLNTLSLHLDFLSDRPERLQVYQLLSDGIQRRKMASVNVPPAQNDYDL